MNDTIALEPELVQEGDYAGRMTREFWASTEYGVERTRGYSCGPVENKRWWCPSVGFSGTEGYSLFDTEVLALDRKIGELDRTISENIKRREGLVERRDAIRTTP